MWKALTKLLLNGRNLAAGSVRLFDAGACLGRRLQFMPFNVLEGMEELPRKSERLKALRPLGFLPCKYMVTKRPLTQEIKSMRKIQLAKKKKK